MVIDASVVVALLLPTTHSDLAFDIEFPDLDVIAPDLLVAEVTNAIWNQRRRGLITHAESVDAFETLDSMPIELHASIYLMRAALDLAIQYDRTVYDSLYVALALREGCQFVTADRRLYNALAPHLLDALVSTDDPAEEETE